MATIYNYLPQILKDIDHPVIMEIGAHYCEDTERIFSLAKNNCSYYVFEPDPRNIDVIKRKPIYKKIILSEAAVGANDKTTKLYMSSGNANPNAADWTGSSSINTPKEHLKHFKWCKFEESVLVKSVCLDTYCQDNAIKYIDFLWVDAQGAEADIFRGAQKTLSKVKYLYSEFYNVEMYEGQITLKEWFKLLPGRWMIISQFSNDVLLHNLSYTK